MMVTFLLATGGHKKVMQAFDYLRAMMKERTRFQLLISSLTNEPVEPTFQVCSVYLCGTEIRELSSCHTLAKLQLKTYAI